MNSEAYSLRHWTNNYNFNLRMYKLWRREAAKPNLIDSKVKQKQQQFSQKLSEVMKLIRRKQQFYTRVLFTPISAPDPIYCSGMATDHEAKATTKHSVNLKHNSTLNSFKADNVMTGSGTITEMSPSRKNFLKVCELQQEVEALIADEEDIMAALKNDEKEEFYYSKTYLYTIFVRLMEIFEFFRQKIQLKIKNSEVVFNKSWSKIYEDNKATLEDHYQNLIFYQNYNLVEFLSLALRKQNYRIYSIVPGKIRKNQISLKPLPRTNSSEIKRANSINIKIPKQAEVTNQLLFKKLEPRDKTVLETQKRIQERKANKQRPIVLKKLYGIMEIKVSKIEEGNAFRKQMQAEALQRNGKIHQEIKKWEKKSKSKTRSLKNLNQSQQ